MIFEIKKTNSVSGVPAGQYIGTFVGIENFTGKKDGKSYARWKWNTAEGRASAINNPDGASPENKLGRFLCLLANRPLSEGTVDASLYIGKQYVLIVEETDKGSAVTSFSMMA